jgi:hypothetical protein
VTNEELRLKAASQLEWIDRYFEKNWLEKDFPSDALWEFLSLPLSNSQQEITQSC